jgi:hypothetical protein
MLNAHERHVKIAAMLDTALEDTRDAERWEAIPDSHDLATAICDLFEPDDDEKPNCTIVAGAIWSALNAIPGIKEVTPDETRSNEITIQPYFMKSKYRVIVHMETESF